MLYFTPPPLILGAVTLISTQLQCLQNCIQLHSTPAQTVHFTFLVFFSGSDDKTSQVIIIYTVAMSGAALAASADMMPVQVVTAAAAVPEPTLSTFYLAYSEEVFKNSVKVILARPAPWAIIPRTHTLCRDPVLAIQAAELHAIESPAKKPKVQGPATRSIYILRLRLHDDDVEPVEEANAFGSKLARSLELSDFEPAHVAETSAELCAATLAEETLYPKPAWRPLADLARDLRQAVIEAKRQSLQQQLREARDVEDKARKEVAKLVRELETL